MIRLTVPSLDESDVAAVARVLQSGMLVQGPEVRAFEAAIGQLTATEHVVAVSNCTAALQVALLALGVGPGDRVAVAAYSWPATANAVELCGAEVVFVDVEPVAFTMDPARLADVLGQHDVKVVLPVHTFGTMADLRRIGELAEAHGAALLEDAACALGAELDGKPAGAWGDAGCFSFHPRKAITTGEGGAVTTSSPPLARRVRALRNHGQDPEASSPDFVLPGFNYRLTDVQAALGLTQLGKFERILAARRAGAAHYDRLFGASALQVPTPLDGASHTYQSYVVLLPAGADRQALIEHLRQRGIESTVGTYHQPLIRYYREHYGYEEGQFPVTDDVARRALTLPLHEWLSADDRELVARTLLDALA